MPVLGYVFLSLFVFLSLIPFISNIFLRLELSKLKKEAIWKGTIPLQLKEVAESDNACILVINNDELYCLKYDGSESTRTTAQAIYGRIASSTSPIKLITPNEVLENKRKELQANKRRLQLMAAKVEAEEQKLIELEVERELC